MYILEPTANLAYQSKTFHVHYHSTLISVPSFIVVLQEINCLLSCLHVDIVRARGLYHFTQVLLLYMYISMLLIRKIVSAQNFYMCKCICAHSNDAMLAQVFCA